MAAMFLLALLPLADCDSNTNRVAATPVNSSSDWKKEATRLLESDGCVALKRYLGQRVGREPLWYELMSQAHMACWRRSGSVADFESAISTLDAGLLAFPRSANLLLSKGYRYRDAGQADLAKRYFRAAQSRAQENLRDDTLTASAADRSTAEAAAEALAEQVDPAIMQARFEQGVLQLIAGGDCAGAIKELRSASAERKNDGWFDLLYVSNHNCFVRTGDATYQQSAQAALTEGLRSFPASPRLLLESAALREEAGDLGGAIQLYKAALDSSEFDKTFPGGRATIEQRVTSLNAKGK